MTIILLCSTEKDDNFNVILDKLRNLEIKVDIILQSKNTNTCPDKNCCEAEGFIYKTNINDNIYYPKCRVCCPNNQECYCRDATYNKRSECECKQIKKGFFY